MDILLRSRHSENMLLYLDVSIVPTDDIRRSIVVSAIEGEDFGSWVSQWICCYQFYIVGI